MVTITFNHGTHNLTGGVIVAVLPLHPIVCEATEVLEDEWKKLQGSGIITQVSKTSMTYMPSVLHAMNHLRYKVSGLISNDF